MSARREGKQPVRQSRSAQLRNAASRPGPAKIVTSDRRGGPPTSGNRRVISFILSIIVAIGCALPASGQIVLDWDFDHGALDPAGTTLSDTLITLGPRTDIYISRWIYCRATGLAGLNPEFRISNDHVAGYSLGDGHRYVYSYDQQNWVYFDNGENSDGYYRFSNSGTFSQDEVWFAYGLPYPWAATEDHVIRALASPWVTPTPSADGNLVLGLSNDGTLTDVSRPVPQHNMYGYLISDPSVVGPKTVVVMTTGNHPNETTGSYTFDGAVDFILSDDPRAVALREAADFYIYPNCNPDGRWAGHARSNPENPNVDHNRDWDDPIGYTDLTVLTAAMKFDTDSQADYFFDFHSFNNTTDIAIWVYAEHTGSDFVTALVQREPTMDVLIGSSPPDSPGVSRHWAHSAAGLNAEYTFTPESGFIPGWQLSRYRLQGENYALALYDAIVVGGCAEVSTSGIVVFEDDFDSGSSGLIWDLYTSSADCTADFGFDYSSHGIPPAPNTPGGTTTGVKFTVNNNDAVAQIEALSAYPTGWTFADNYALKFDLWINYNGGAGGGSGSTEFMLAGINHGGAQVNWPENPASDGASFAVSGEGGAVADYRAYDGPTEYAAGSGVYAAGSQNHTAALYQALFPDPPYETQGAPGKQWVTVEIRQLVGRVEWRLNDVLVAAVSGASDDSGAIMIGYLDPFASIANPSADNFIIYDNVRVEQLPDTDCNGNTVADACEVIAAGDFDADGDADLDDLAALGDCLTGPDAVPAPAQPGCVDACRRAFDADEDGDVDLDDFAEFQLDFTG
ncbi:MAG: hypothetical protein GY778_13300 [bacterium]|nr:hypothetical protein [bacterium]